MGKISPQAAPALLFEESCRFGTPTTRAGQFTTPEARQLRLAQRSLQQLRTAVSRNHSQYLKAARKQQLARSPVMASVFGPYLRIANSLPRIVLAPIFLLWFGGDIWSKVALGVTVVFFVVFFNTFRGLREVDAVMIDNARILGASERQLIWHVLIPSALTWIFSSLHVSIGLVIIAVFVSEYMNASAGIGYMIAQYERTSDATGVFAGITILALGVLAVGSVVDRVERHLMRWKPSRAGLEVKEVG